jgi:hypothetical protein
VYAFGGSIDLEAAPSKYDKGVGNLEKEFVPFMIYNYAVQQAGWEIVGEFRPYLLFGVATGNATLDADPLNPAGGTVLKTPTEIAAKLVNYDIGSSHEHKLIRYILRTHIFHPEARFGWKCRFHLIQRSLSMVSSFIGLSSLQQHYPKWGAVFDLGE